MKSRLWMVRSAVVMVVVLGLVSAGCSRKPKTAAPAKVAPTPVAADASKVAKVVGALVSATPKAIAVSSDGSVVLAACDSAAHDTGSAPGLYISTDHGKTWVTNAIQEVWRGAAMAADGKRMAASAAKNGGVWVSSDSGATWAKTHDQSSWALAMSGDGKVLVTGGDPGPLSVSSDYGKTWVTVQEGKMFWTGAAVSADGTKLAAVAKGKLTDGEEGPQGEGHPIFESADGGATWTTRESARRWTAIRMSGDGVRQVAVAGSSEVFVSQDGGATWEGRKQGNMSASRVAMSADGMRIVVGAEGGSDVISYSADGGQTWKESPFNKSTFAIGMSADGSHVFCGYLHTYRLDVSF